jgi:hypothetical protein
MVAVGEKAVDFGQFVTVVHVVVLSDSDYITIISNSVSVSAIPPGLQAWIMCPKFYNIGKRVTSNLGGHLV